MAAIVAEVDLADRPDADMIERGLRSAFVAHGKQPPSAVTGMSRVMAAGSGPRGTRSARLSWLGARAVGRAVWWAWQPGSSAAADRRSLRRLYSAGATLVAVAVASTTGAVRTPGRRRLPWAVAALLAWSFTARTVAVGVLVTTVVRGAKVAGPDS
jgi:hypothetical protein